MLSVCHEGPGMELSSRGQRCSPAGLGRRLGCVRVRCGRLSRPRTARAFAVAVVSRPQAPVDWAQVPTQAKNSIVPAPYSLLPSKRVDEEKEPAVPVFITLSDEACTLWQPQALRTRFRALKGCGVWGVAVDAWWGHVEGWRPRHYDWQRLHVVMHAAKDAGLRVKVAFCFHGDAQHPLPSWVLSEGRSNPEVFFADRAGFRSAAECLSIGIDDAPVLAGRTAVQAYRDLMESFAAEFGHMLGGTVSDVLVGLGPGGELRYPSHPTQPAQPLLRRADARSISSSSCGSSVTSLGSHDDCGLGGVAEAALGRCWTYPGVGEFQCYDRYMLASLQACAHAVRQPHWALGGPHDAGSYTQWPHQTGFFHHQGGWASEYGRFFLSWYSSLLVRHAEAVLGAAAEVFGARGSGGGGLVQQQQQAAAGGGGVRLHAALPLVHWWYNQAAHAAELTAGLYNTVDRDGYLPALMALRRSGARLHLPVGDAHTVGASAQHPPGHALSDPDALLLQLRTAAAALHVPVTLCVPRDVQLDDAVLEHLESRAYESSCRQGVDVGPVAAVQLAASSEQLLYSASKELLKSWAARARSAAAEAEGEAQQQQQQQQLADVSAATREQQHALCV